MFFLDKQKPALGGLLNCAVFGLMGVDYFYVALLRPPTTHFFSYSQLRIGVILLKLCHEHLLFLVALGLGFQPRWATSAGRVFTYIPHLRDVCLQNRDLPSSVVMALPFIVGALPSWA
jgi:hypothetical protein